MISYQKILFGLRQRLDKGQNDYENNIFVACVYKISTNSTCSKFNDSNVIDRLEQQSQNWHPQIQF